jgi:hypothetical protein
MTQAEGLEHQDLQIIGVYATPWQRHGRWVEEAEPGVRPGRLGEFYSFYQDLVPQPFFHGGLAGEDIAFNVPTPNVQVQSAEAWLFRLPSDQVVAAVTLDVRGTALAVDVSPVSGLLEQFRNGELSINGIDMSDYFSSHASDLNTLGRAGATDLLPERHHIVLFPAPGTWAPAARRRHRRPVRPRLVKP